MTEALSTLKPSRNIFTPIAWAATLLVSLLPDILFRELTDSLPTWLYWAKVSLMVALLLASLLWEQLQPLWLFAAVLLTVYLLEGGVGRFFETLHYKSWLISASPFV